MSTPTERRYRREARYSKQLRVTVEPATGGGTGTPAEGRLIRWRCGAWTHGGGPPRLTTPSLAVYLGTIYEAGRAPASAAMAVAAVRFRARLAGQADPAGERTARVLGGFRRTAADRGRGQAAPLRADGLAAILATAERPRTDGRGVESHTTAHRRGRLDAVIASLVVHGRAAAVGSRRRALEWRDVSDASDGDGDGMLVTVRYVNRKRIKRGTPPTCGI